MKKIFLVKILVGVIAIFFISAVISYYFFNKTLYYQPKAVFENVSELNPYLSSKTNKENNNEKIRGVLFVNLNYLDQPLKGEPPIFHPLLHSITPDRLYRSFSLIKTTNHEYKYEYSEVKPYQILEYEIKSVGFIRKTEEEYREYYGKVGHCSGEISENQESCLIKTDQLPGNASFYFDNRPDYETKTIKGKVFIRSNLALDNLEIVLLDDNHTTFRHTGDYLTAYPIDKPTNTQPISFTFGGLDENRLYQIQVIGYAKDTPYYGSVITCPGQAQTELYFAGSKFESKKTTITTKNNDNILCITKPGNTGLEFSL